jgi:hypothetical protein
MVPRSASPISRAGFVAVASDAVTRSAPANRAAGNGAIGGAGRTAASAVEEAAPLVGHRVADSDEPAGRFAPEGNVESSQRHVVKVGDDTH